mmetsp:Transcript_28605/g.42291  ORF Transcript_28605/g.42291 Transcript_28605/m.42291 type:complete len:157 (+) Transcript_28605:49-519(+)
MPRSISNNSRMSQQLLTYLFSFYILFATNGGFVSGLAQNSRRAFLLKQTTAAAFGFSLPGIVHSNEAIAYPRRDVGSEGSRSAETAAYNEQAYLTNNRLEANGFKFDTPKEEEEKLSSALSSFSYDSNVQSSKKASGRRSSSTSATPSKYTESIAK